MTMMLSEKHISAIHKILTAGEIIEPSSPEYGSQKMVWSGQKDRHPRLVLKPRSLPALQKTVKYLCESDLDFAVRSGGAGSSSASDIVLTMSAFNGFHFDRNTEVATVGAGQTWGDIDRKIEESAPGYAGVGVRVPFIGVGGSLSFCVSWISNNFGMGSDPQNLLDARIVLPDGRELWASEDPGLLWALRGGGGNFGVITEAKIKVHPFTSNICCFTIRFPDYALPAVSEAVSAFSKRPSEPKVAMHVFLMDLEQRTLRDEAPKACLELLIYDAHGKEHAQSEEGFKWALDIDGAMVGPMSSVTLRQMNESQAKLRSYMGMNGCLSTAITDNIDRGILIRGKKWWEQVIATNPFLGANTYMILEVMQEAVFASSGGRGATAWPHDSRGHILQLCVGSAAENGFSEELALDLLRKAPAEILPCHRPGDYIPLFIHEFHDLSQIFGQNYERLREIKTKYDPHGRLNKGFFIPPFKTCQ
ncbi:hypothetical protein V8E54_006481 [Elaphomyces granulatus]